MPVRKPDFFFPLFRFGFCGKRELFCSRRAHILSNVGRRLEAAEDADVDEVENRFDERFYSAFSLLAFRSFQFTLTHRGTVFTQTIEAIDKVSRRSK